MTADECRPPAEKRCEAKKSNMPKSQSASSADGMTVSQTLTAVRNESTKAKHPSICWVRLEVSAPPRVAALTIP